MLKVEMHNRQVIKCGIKSAYFGVIFLIAVYYGADILSSCGKYMEMVVAFVSSLSWLMLFFEAVGSAHFSIHVLALSVYLWSLCVWWKLGAFNPVVKIRDKYFFYTSGAFCLAFIFMMSGYFYQYEVGIRLLEVLLSFVLWFCYAVSFFGLCRKSGSEPEGAK